MGDGWTRVGHSHNRCNPPPLFRRRRNFILRKSTTLRPEELTMDTLLNDLRFGARMLARNPGFALVAVLMLAIGIGANSAIFSVVNGVLLAPLPYPHQEQLVMIAERAPQFGSMMVSYPNYLDWRTQKQRLEDIAVYNRFVKFNLTGGERAERLNGGLATANFFDVLGRQPVLGRGFLPEDWGPSTPAVAVLSDALWHNRFGGDSNVLGRTLMLDGETYSVVGVLPPDVTFAGVDVWVP